MRSRQGAGRVEQTDCAGSTNIVIRRRTGLQGSSGGAEVMGESMLEGKVALVTGASRGIGQAIAVALGKAGATVGGTATSDAGAAGISDYLRNAGLKGAGFKLDVTDAG